MFSRGMVLAFYMGWHARLGTDSLVGLLDMKGVGKMVVDMFLRDACVLCSDVRWELSDAGLVPFFYQ